VAPTAFAPPPPDTDAARYRQVQQALGLERAVVVQPTAYGFDNSCTLDAIAKLGAGARGIAVVPTDITDEELARLTRAGIRGVRYFMLRGGLLPWDTLEAMAARVANHGWLVQIQLDGRELPKYEATIARLPVPAIIDHNGKFLEPVPVNDPAFQSLLRLLDSGRVWAKLAAPYETSKIGPPHYDDVSKLARAMVKANPERCIWASNWPHPGITPTPDSGAMLDLLLEWADDDATRRKILVENPAKLFGYH
jgi:D-galactarolactone isomerase